MGESAQATSERDGQPINETPAELCGLRAVLNCELPNNMTNDFNGSVEIERGCDAQLTVMVSGKDGEEPKEVKESVSIRNVLLRGCILKNTKFVFGAVISTGTDTKVEFKLNPLKWYQLGVSSCFRGLTVRSAQSKPC